MKVSWAPVIRLHGIKYLKKTHVTSSQKTSRRKGLFRLWKILLTVKKSEKVQYNMQKKMIFFANIVIKNLIQTKTKHSTKKLKHKKSTCKIFATPEKFKTNKTLKEHIRKLHDGRRDVIKSDKSTR